MNGLKPLFSYGDWVSLKYFCTSQEHRRYKKMNEIIENWDVVCHRCGYAWITRSKYIMVTCPSCQFRTKKIKTEEDWKRINLRKKQRNKCQENNK